MNAVAALEPATISESGYTNAPLTTKTAGSTYETFYRDKETAIRAIIARGLGKRLTLPMGVRPPKVDAPAKYRGEDDLDLFVKWVELVCTWLQAMLLCGYDLGVDRFRLSMVKSNLEGYALEWYIQTVPQQRLTFTEVLCALHHRFVTSANAQRATRAFDAV
ncbi:hypothetical protein C8J57DRAFT_1060886, partial [Mycena rebaudengoi]